MNTNSSIRQPRGVRQGNIGDAQAEPLMNARVVYLALSDASSGKNLDSALGYFRRSLGWFHKSVQERDFSFMLSKADDPSGRLGRRPDHFRKAAGEVCAKLVRLAVANRRRELADMCAAIRADADQYLVQRYLTLLSPCHVYESRPEQFGYIDRLRQGTTFSQLQSEAQFITHCSTELAYAHEFRLREFAALTNGLCA